MDNVDVINAIYAIKYSTGDLLTDYKGGHYGNVFEDIDIIEGQLDIIKRSIKDDRVVKGKLESVGNTDEKDMLISEWYAEEYPDDTEVMYDANDVSFDDVLQMMVQYGGGNFYDYVGVGDSVVRNRIFEKIADIYGVSYDDVYHLWLDEYNEISNNAVKKFGI